MPPAASSRAILLDIEGTVAPISFVHEVLFPYSREKMEDYLRAHWNDPPVAAARAMLWQGSGAFSESSVDSLKQILFDLMDRDVKSTGLKQLQGLIWEEGYRAGAFASPVYSDVPGALARWHDAGKLIAIYSSGSTAAQKVFFRYTVAGDLTRFLSGYFDTTTGPKRSSSSYVAIANSLNILPGGMVFISDVAEEVGAAVAAGMRGLIAVRPGNAVLTTDAYRRLSTFDQVD